MPPLAAVTLPLSVCRQSGPPSWLRCARQERCLWYPPRFSTPRSPSPCRLRMQLHQLRRRKQKLSRPPGRLKGGHGVTWRPPRARWQRKKAKQRKKTVTQLRRTQPVLGTAALALHWSNLSPVIILLWMPLFCAESALLRGRQLEITHSPQRWRGHQGSPSLPIDLGPGGPRVWFSSVPLSPLWTTPPLQQTPGCCYHPLGAPLRPPLWAPFVVICLRLRGQRPRGWRCGTKWPSPRMARDWRPLPAAFTSPRGALWFWMDEVGGRLTSNCFSYSFSMVDGMLKTNSVAILLLL